MWGCREIEFARQWSNPTRWNDAINGRTLFGNLQQFRKIDAGTDTHVFKKIHQVFAGGITACARCKWTTADTANRALKAAYPSTPSGISIDDAKTIGIMTMKPPTQWQQGDVNIALTPA